jgi:hypothetical protein
MAKLALILLTGVVTCFAPASFTFAPAAAVAEPGSEPANRGNGAIEAPDLIPTYNETIRTLTDRKKEILHSIIGFEEARGLQTGAPKSENIFWCAENIPTFYRSIDKAVRARGNVGWPLWGPIDYCQKKHFPTESKGDCASTISAYRKLAAMYPDFGRSRFKASLVEKCGRL